MTIVLQSDAKAAIVADFGTWAAGISPGTSADSRLYYSHLQTDKANLLKFRHPNPDKWQVVHAWLSDAGLVAD